MNTEITSLAHYRKTAMDDDMTQASILPDYAPQLNRDHRLYWHAHETAIALGVEPGMSPSELYLLKKNDRINAKKPVTADFNSRRTTAMLAYQERTGNHLLPLILKRGKYIAEMDGVSDDRQFVLNIQLLGNDYAGQDLREKIQVGVLPEHHKLRLQHMMLVADAQIAHLWLWDEERKSGVLAAIKRCQRDCARICTIWMMFQDRMEAGRSWPASGL